MKYKLNGKTVTREEFMRNARGVEAGCPPGGQRTGWPHVAEMQGVPRHQKLEAQEYLASKGVETDYVDRGSSSCPVWRDRGHRNKWMRAMGYMDRSAGYGDYAGKY